MARKSLIIIGAVAAIGLAVGATAVGAVRYAPDVVTSAMTAEFAHFGGRGHGMQGRGMARICSDRRDRHIDRMADFVEGFVDLNPEQTEAWTRLTETVRQGSATVGETCDQLQADGMPETAPERLAMVETMMTTGLSIMQDVRPAFDAFYATLSERQRKALDNLTERRRHN